MNEPLIFKCSTFSVGEKVAAGLDRSHIGVGFILMEVIPQWQYAFLYQVFSYGVKYFVPVSEKIFPNKEFSIVNVILHLTPSPLNACCALSLGAELK